jgi:hypothetical protein
MPTNAPHQRFEVNLAEEYFRILLPAGSAWFSGAREIRVEFHTTYPEFHLGLIALVARELRKKTSLRQTVPASDILTQIEVLNLAPLLKGQPQTVTEKPPLDALHRYFCGGLRRSLSEDAIYLDGKAATAEDFADTDCEALQQVVVAQGSPKPNKASFDMRGLATLGLHPDDISPEVDLELSRCLLRIEREAAANPVLRRFTRDEATFMRELRHLGIQGVQQNGIIPNTAPFAEAQDICILAFSAVGLLGRIRDELTSALQRGAKLRVILADPESVLVGPSLKLTFQSEERSELIRDIVQAEGLLHQIANGAAMDPPQAQGPGTIALGHFQTEFRCFLAIRDRSWGWFTPHLPPKLSRETPSFELIRGRMLDDCINYFEALWASLVKAGRVEMINVFRSGPEDGQTAPGSNGNGVASGGQSSGNPGGGALGGTTVAPSPAQ